MSVFKTDLVLDGAMGTQLIERAGLRPGVRPESLNTDAPDIVAGVHRDYIAAGSGLILANTFGADTPDTVAAGCRIALSAAGDKAAVAVDMGPTGRIVTPADFDSLYERFRTVAQAAYAAGVRVAVIETMGALTELRAALLAAKDTGLDTLAMMTFERNGRTYFGTDARSFAVTAAGLGADAVGANCSLGAGELLFTAERLLSVTTLPVVIKPNAGLPRIADGRAIYDETPEQFKAGIAALKNAGVDIVGGCCGTTPDFIRAIADLKAAPRPPVQACSVLCSESTFLTVDGPMTVGERINPTGKPAFRKALTEGNLDCIADLAIEQKADGAELLDVNVGVAGKEAELMPEVLCRILRVSDRPLVIDSSSPDVVEKALRLYPGKALVNSACAKAESLATVLPLCRRYGAAVVGLTLGDDGIPADVAGRAALAEKIVAAAEKAGIPRRDVYIDALTMAEASGRGGARVTLETLRRAKAMGARTILGVSNISFGMPLREDINAAFLESAVSAGLDLAIVNPKYRAYKGSPAAKAFLEGGSADDYIAYASGAHIAPPEADEPDLTRAVLTGNTAAAARLSEALLAGLPPLEVAGRYVIPALDEVGRKYDDGTMFLPQLISAADAAGAAFDRITAHLQGDGNSIGRFVIATVEGDIHTIGKNITAAVCRSYNIEVTDLGMDVPSSRILEALEEKYPCVLGLSALMTTTALNMEKIIADVRKVYPDIVILAGGAALTEDFARKIGAVYCASATDTAAYLKKYFTRNYR